MAITGPRWRGGRRRYRAGLVSFLAFATAGVCLAQTPKRVYIAPDDHTDYFWSAGEAAYQQAFLNTLDYYLDQADSTAANPDNFQGRWNCDGSFWMWTFEKNRTAAQFQRLIDRIRDGHISVPLNSLALYLGGTPAEAVLRGMYYPGQIERRHGLRFPLAYSMENQTLPLGLGSLWAGSGARYSWRGICACVSLVTDAWDREHDMYWYTGLDGNRILMKWNSMLQANTSIGGYAEARTPSAVVDFVTDGAPFNGFAARHPYNVIGAFGKGWDDLQTLTSEFITVAMAKTNPTRSVRVSNEQDFFADFEATYSPDVLPAVTTSFGNEWELAVASLAEVSGQVKRSVESLRAAEALATLVSLGDACFMEGRQAARDLAWMDLGNFWEHNFGMFDRTGTVLDDRIAWQRRLAGEIDAYVTPLLQDGIAALGAMIQKSGVNPRYFAFNPLSWTRTDMVDLPYTGPTPVQVVDLVTGLETPSQVVVVDGQTRLRILAPDVPSVGYKVFEVRPGIGQSFPPAAVVTGNFLESDLYKVGVTGGGAITSLIDKSRANREMVRVVNGRAVNDLGGASGSIQTENAGPVSVTLLASGPLPLQHATRVTLIRGLERIEIRNDINQNFTGTQTWAFGFNLDGPDVRHEEVGALLRAKLTTQGGHYATRNARYDWLTLNHFADMTGSTGGITLSNADAYFMRLGNSTPDVLDAATPQISVLAGGRVVMGSAGLPNQGGDTHFLQRFALQPRDTYDPAAAMRFALEHQNPLIAGSVAGGSVLPQASYSVLSVDNPDVILWALKPAEEGIGRGIVSRLWNLRSSAASATVSFSPGPVRNGIDATHIETPIGLAAVAGGSLQASFAGQQMRTFINRLDAGPLFASPVLSVDRMGQDVVLSWSGTGQACSTVLRSTSPQFSGAVTLHTGPGTTAVDPGAAAGTSVLFYTVD